MRTLTKRDFDKLSEQDAFIGVEFDSGTRKVLTKVGANEYAFINFELMDKTSSPSKHSSMATALVKVKHELSGAFVFSNSDELYEFLMNY